MLRNESTNSAIIGNLKFADNFLRKLKGLMFEQKKNFDYGLVFEFSRESRIGASIHMLFVFFPIDVVYLDSGRKVVDVATVNPWTINYTPKKAAKYLVELPVGKAKEIKIGNELSWK